LVEEIVQIKCLMCPVEVAHSDVHNTGSKFLSLILRTPDALG